MQSILKDDLVEQAEKLGNEGKVEEAQGVMKLCDQLKKERQQLENLSNDRPENTPQAKQMEVCPICGAFLIVGDAESRQREHLLGKQHMGYAQVCSLICAVERLRMVSLIVAMVICLLNLNHCR